MKIRHYYANDGITDISLSLCLDRLFILCKSSTTPTKNHQKHRQQQANSKNNLFIFNLSMNKFGRSSLPASRKLADT